MDNQFEDLLDKMNEADEPATNREEDLADKKPKKGILKPQHTKAEEIVYNTAKATESKHMDIQFGLMVLDESGEVVHFCGYENEPTKADRRHLFIEMKTDPELGLVGRDDLRILPATTKVLEQYRSLFEANMFVADRIENLEAKIAELDKMAKGCRKGQEQSSLYAKIDALEAELTKARIEAEE